MFIVGSFCLGHDGWPYALFEHYDLGRTGCLIMINADN